MEVKKLDWIDGDPYDFEQDPRDVCHALFKGLNHTVGPARFVIYKRVDRQLEYYSCTLWYSNMGHGIPNCRQDSVGKVKAAAQEFINNFVLDLLDDSDGAELLK